jgi:hypothetical protein
MEFSHVSTVTYKAIELLLFSYEYCSPELTFKLLSALTSSPLQDTNELELGCEVEEIKTSFEELCLELRECKDVKNTISQVWDSLEFLWRLREILKGKESYWYKCVEALQFGNPIATHNQVIEALSNVMNPLTDKMRLDIECLFSESEVKDKLGLSFESLNELRKMINDDALYMNVLSKLSVDSHLNWSWKEIFDDVSSLVYETKPEISEHLDMFLWDKYTSSIGYIDNNEWYGEYCEHVYRQTEAIDSFELQRELSNLCLTPTTPTFSSMV